MWDPQSVMAYWFCSQGQHSIQWKYGVHIQCWCSVAEIVCVLLQISAGVNVGLWVQIGNNNRQGVNKKVYATCASVLSVFSYTGYVVVTS